MTDADRYERRADQIERAARETANSAYRRQLLALAKDWRDLAERAAFAEPRAIPGTARDPEPEAS